VTEEYLQLNLRDLRSIRWLEGGFIETLAIVDSGGDEVHVTFLGVQIDGNLTGTVRFYEGTTLYRKFKLGKIASPISVYFNLIYTPRLADFYAKAQNVRYTCEAGFCFTDESFLTFKGTISSCRDVGEFVECSLSVHDSALLFWKNVPLINRFVNALLEALVHLSRVECLSRGECRAGSLKLLCEKLWIFLEVLRTQAKNEIMHEALMEIEKRTRVCG